MLIEGQSFAPDGRYHRQTLIDWWEQERVERARFLVIGAGALGNEVLKNLALLGARRLLVYDMDDVEESNLSRAVLLREDGRGRPKVEAVAGALAELGPDAVFRGRTENIMTGAGLGVFAWADVVLGCVDNREARVFINAACARTGRVWVDGAIEALSGIVRAFDPARGACYECTMNEIDRKLVAERRSCAMLARDVAARGHVPATVVAASIIGAMQTQEALKVLHGQPALVGEGLHVDGRWGEVSRVQYPRRDECMGHETAGPVTALGAGVADLPFGELLDRAEAALGEGAVLDLSRDFVLALDCAECGTSEPCGRAVGAVGEREARCPACGGHRFPRTVASVGRDGPVDLAATPASIGVPPFDLVFPRRGLEESHAWLFDGDAPLVLGALAEGLE